MNRLAPLALLLTGACATTSGTLDAPRVDYHQHLVSEAFAPIVGLPARDGTALLAEMDRAGVRQAVVLSVAYSFADERKKLANPDVLSRAENDWTSGQVVAARGRLVGFCSANPLRDAALEEIERCLALEGMKGVKLHLGNGGITLRNADHVDRLRAIFALAERHGVPVLAHMRPRGGVDYGAEDVVTFLDKVMPMAPSVPVIVAHLGASSPGYPAQNDEIMEAFAQAAERGDPRMRNLYFDVAANVDEEVSAADGELIAKRMRAIGIDHFLYGSDLTPPGGSIASGWRIFRAKTPLTNAEFATIARQRLPFMR